MIRGLGWSWDIPNQAVASAMHMMRLEVVRVLLMSTVLSVLILGTSHAATVCVDVRGQRPMWATVELLRNGQPFRRAEVKLERSDRGYAARMSWDAPPRARYNAVVTCDERGIVVQHRECPTFLHPWQYGRTALKCGDFELVEAQSSDVDGGEEAKPVLSVEGMRVGPHGGVVRLNLPRPGEVQLKLVDVTGRVVRTLQDGVLGSGETLIKLGRNVPGEPAVRSGVYFCKLKYEGVTRSAQIVVLP